MPSELWQRIKAARKSADISQTDIAKQMGCTRAAVSLWEQSNAAVRTNPSLAQLKKLAEITGAPITWLVSDNSEINGEFTDITEEVFYVPLLEWGEVSSYLKEPMNRLNNKKKVITPASLGKEAFAVTANDDTLSPLILKGDCVYIDPEQKPTSGDVVLIYNSQLAAFSMRKYSQDAGVEFVAHTSSSMPNPVRPMMEEEEIVGVAVLKVTSLM